jgi:hypothetical protein
MSTRRGFWSRPRGPLLLGAVACAACCATPLVAIAIGAGAASTVAAIAEPIAGVLLATGALLGIVMYVRHRRTRAVTGARCGCGPADKRVVFSSPEPVADAPIACTADLRDRDQVQAGMDRYRAAFRQLIATEPTSDGFRWRFRGAPGLEAELRSLAKAEHACCSFMRFEVTTDGTELVWETSADAGAREVIEEYMRLPERLREEPRAGLDVTHIKEHALRSGITFTSDAR